MAITHACKIYRKCTMTMERRAYCWWRHAITWINDLYHSLNGYDKLNFSRCQWYFSLKSYEDGYCFNVIVLHVHYGQTIAITHACRIHRHQWKPRRIVNLLLTYASMGTIADILRTIFPNIFVGKTFCVSIQISTKFVSIGPIDSSSPFIPIMAWRLRGDTTLHEPMKIQFAHTYMRH